MQLTVLSIGRVPDPATRQLCEEYQKRLGRHLKVQLVEVRSAEEAMRRVEPLHHVIALTSGGVMRSSEDFARWLDQKMTYGRSPLLFVIGGAEGLPATLGERADEAISLGPMTLPHRLARVLLLEQLYRALTILRGEPYHK
ncbi:MAG: 23S rRNA (pseudouridine(1915)-N(3))-methyltransferase RlmH [Polyangia bacterium]|jgi:23S rRNA (pseudouridine1915-N3)-methyltransferase|nr:23S rRNA (pseudouridine(1915)-N(3))-methyltransferase RlmH [Polyangia bacterium]